ncbi:MAG TPA: glycosyltransferase family 2 protein [Methylotenera sp.]|nr:glycosyltransferase family 2 protein [Methylotenera sp.]
MPDFKLTTPVAFIIFNRPDTTELVFAEIAKAKPTKLLVVADGARTNKVGEAEKVAATRAIIQRVDWDCEVLTNFSDVNLGCKRRVSSGLDWVFQQVEEAIILEDDCLPDPTFFRFCQEMLERYRHDQRIGIISGDNFQFGHRRNDDSYYFSKYVHIWGWATWRDRWQNSYDVELKKWPAIRDGGWLEDMLGNKKEASTWMGTFERIYKDEIDTWDYQWVFANWLEGRINVMPNVNLISNIGFGVDATHTVSGSHLADLPVNKMLFPITHPVGVFRNLQADMFSFQQFFNVPVYKKIYNKVLGLLK